MSLFATETPVVDLLARPTGREEAWRFTPLNRLGGLLDGQAGEVTALDVDFDLPEGVAFTTEPSTTTTIPPADILAVHAVDQAPGTAKISIPAGSLISTPLRVTLRGKDAADPSYLHLVIEVGRGASGIVLLDHVGSATTSEYVEVLLADGSELTLVTVQDTDSDAVLGARHAALVGRDARYRHVNVSLGGDLVRVAPTVAFSGPGGDVELSGVFLTGAGQHHENRLLVDHTAPHCKSRVAYKGALQGEGAHSVWIGDVVIRAEAVGTDTYELNRNLVLTDGAHADSVPNLEIETGEVAGAGHASATGRFDEEQLFYLMARGIPEGEAKRLVVRGFFAEVLDRLSTTLPDLRARILQRVEERV